MMEVLRRRADCVIMILHLCPRVSHLLYPWIPRGLVISLILHTIP